MTEVLQNLETLFASGLAVNFALGVIALEFGYLLWRAPRDGRKDRVLTLVLALGPGACLMLALNCALTQKPLSSVAFFLALSLPLHIADVIRRRL